MRVIINQAEHELPPTTTLNDVVTLHATPPPFAVAVNLQFVPHGQYSGWLLQADDRIDIIAPVTGG